MNKDLSSLVETVEREAEVLESLSGLMRRQKAAAVAGDLEELNRATEAQERAYARLSQLESERLEKIQPIADELALKPGDVTLTLLGERFGAELGSGWERAVKLLNNLAEEVKRSAKLNGMIIERCQELGEQRFRSLVDFQQRGPAYGSSGKKKVSGTKSGMVLNQQL